jgi:lipopolysaccharide export system protein LptC
MTDPADSPAHQDEVRVAATAKAFRARSRRVQLLRRVLPVAIIVLAGGTLSWIVLRSVMSDVERKAGTSREIRLDTLRFHGQDAAGRSFVIGAKGAVRDPDTGHYRLVGPALRLNLGGRKVTTLTADGGVYDEAGQDRHHRPECADFRRWLRLYPGDPRGGGRHRDRYCDG